MKELNKRTEKLFRHYDKAEINLLNYWLKFAVSLSKIAVDDIVACIESFVQYMPTTLKVFIKKMIKNQCSKEKSDQENQAHRNKNVFKPIKAKGVLPKSR